MVPVTDRIPNKIAAPKTSVVMRTSLLLPVQPLPAPPLQRVGVVIVGQEYVRAAPYAPPRWIGAARLRAPNRGTDAYDMALARGIPRTKGDETE